MAFEKNVFVNCPFDKTYVDMLRPILFTILALGFEPRIASERADGAEVRVEKIVELIEESKYAIHDLSRLKSGGLGEYYRLNMPFELGVDYGCRLYKGDPWSGKKILILEDSAHEMKKALSDLSGSDVEPHENDPIRIPGIVRNWLAQSIAGDVVPPSLIWARFTDFTAENYVRLTAAHWTLDDIEKQPTRELIIAMRDWLSSISI